VAESKRYYWLQLQKDFFKTRAMKKLRSIAGGDTYTIIYLKMQLLSLENGGLLFHEGVEEDMLDEIALDIDESVDNVRITFQFLEKCNLIESKVDQMFLPEAVENIGSETSSAQRQRRFRSSRDQKALQCNSDVTESNTDVQTGNVELELELEIEKKIYKASFEKDFLEIYSEYPVKKGKAPALRKYQEYRRNNNIPDKSVLIDHIKRSIETKEWKDGYIPHFSTWMNKKRWEDELESEEIKVVQEVKTKTAEERYNEMARSAGYDTF